MRSRAAAAILSREGFERVYSMEGGINAWKGLVAKGVPDAGMAYFGRGKTAEELTALAYLLEEGSRKFYAEMSLKGGEREFPEIFRELAADEEKHKSSLAELNPALSGRLGTAVADEAYLEGGMLLREALDWAREKEWKEVLDLSILLEANAIDLYIKMERAVGEGRSKELFRELSNQERTHLQRLSRFLEES